MTAPVPPEAVEAAMEALLERYGLGADDSDAERIAAAAVAALDLPGREREAATKARRARYCGCVWCCATTKPEDRGEAHRNCGSALGEGDQP